MDYLTTAEVAELKGCTPQYVRRLCQNGTIKANVRADAANNRTEYEIALSELSEKIQIKYENKKRGELGLEPIPLPRKAAPKPDPRQITLQDLTGDQRRDVGFWCEIIKGWQAARQSKGAELGKCKVDELYCATIKLRCPNVSISPDILYRKYKAYKDGDIDGLIDHRGGHNRGKTDAPEFLHKIAQTAEGVRGAVRLFGNAYDMGNYDFNGLVKMAKMMHLDLKGLEKAVRKI